MWFNFDHKEVAIIIHGLNRFAATGDWKDLRDKIERSVKEQNNPSNKLWLEKAKELHQEDGEVELDEQGDDSVYMSSSDQGAYLMAWTWVSNEDMEACVDCGSIPGTPEYGTVGDGHNGKCPSCADKKQAALEAEEKKRQPVDPAPLSGIDALRKLLVDERTEKIKAFEDANPDVGMPPSLSSMRTIAIASLVMEGKLPPDWSYDELMNCAEADMEGEDQ